MPSWQSAFFAHLNRLSGPRRVGAKTAIADVRAQYERLSDRFGQIPADAVFETAQLGPVKGEWARVEVSNPARLILYFPGGGYIAGSPESHRPLIARLCEASEAAAFAINYRKAPEFAFPAGLRDGIDAYRHLIARGVPASSIVLAGDGAGGGLAFSCALAIRNAGLPMPAAIAAMSPWADLSLSGFSLLENARSDVALNWQLLFVSARHYLKKQSPADPYASPVYASFHDFPPIMVHAGSAEILRDDASRLGDRAAEAGISVSVEIYDGMQHVFQASPYVPEARISLGRLGAFIKARAQVEPPLDEVEPAAAER
jgi:acetyl esterase/lipase